jgi:hypothetical protein
MRMTKGDVNIVLLGSYHMGVRRILIVSVLACGAVHLFVAFMHGVWEGNSTLGMESSLLWSQSQSLCILYRVQGKSSCIILLSIENHWEVRKRQSPISLHAMPIRYNSQGSTFTQVPQRRRYVFSIRA